MTTHIYICMCIHIYIYVYVYIYIYICVYMRGIAVASKLLVRSVTSLSDQVADVSEVGRDMNSRRILQSFTVTESCVFSMGFFAGSLQGSLAVRRGVLCRVLARFPTGFISEFSQGFSVVLRPSGVGVLQGSLGGSPGSPWDSLAVLCILFFSADFSQGFLRGSILSSVFIF